KSVGRRENYEIARPAYECSDHVKKHSSGKRRGRKSQQWAIFGRNSRASGCGAHRAWRNSRLRPGRLAGAGTGASGGAQHKPRPSAEKEKTNRATEPTATGQ